jgi:hypothetical protein
MGSAPKQQRFWISIQRADLIYLPNVRVADIPTTLRDKEVVMSEMPKLTDTEELCRAAQV